MPQPISVSAPPSQLRDSGFNYQVRKKEPVPQKESSFSFLKKESFAPVGGAAGQRSAPKRLEDRIIPETPEMPKSSEVEMCIRDSNKGYPRRGIPCLCFSEIKTTGSA